jgi:hypothetical protein
MTDPEQYVDETEAYRLMRYIDEALAAKDRALHPAEWEIVMETLERVL